MTSRPASPIWGCPRFRALALLRRRNGRANPPAPCRASEKPAQEETQAAPRQQPHFGTLRCRWRKPSTASGS